MAHFAKFTAREAPSTPGLIEHGVTAGAVVGGIVGGIMIGGAVDPPLRFAGSGSTCGEVGAFEAPAFCSRAHGGATVGGVGVTAAVVGLLVGTAAPSVGLIC